MIKSKKEIIEIFDDYYNNNPIFKKMLSGIENDYVSIERKEYLEQYWKILDAIDSAKEILDNIVSQDTIDTYYETKIDTLKKVRTAKELEYYTQDRIRSYQGIYS